MFIFFQCNRVTKDHNGELQLEKEARKWATKIAKENKIITEYNRNIKSLQEPSPDEIVSWQIGSLIPMSL